MKWRSQTNCWETQSRSRWNWPILSPPAFAQTKAQIRQAVSERYAASGKATDKAATDIWCAPVTLDYIRAYVARTLKKR